MSDALPDPAPAITNPLLGVTRQGNDRGLLGEVSGATSSHSTRPARSSQTLRLLAAFRALRRTQLERLLFQRADLSVSSRRVVTHRLLGDLRERGLVEAVVAPGSIVDGGFRAYVLTPAGRRAYAATDPCYPNRRMRTTSALLLLHAIALADIALAFRESVAVTTDARLCWESDWAINARLGTAVAIPDAFVTLEQGGWRVRAFIEADRGTEGTQSFEQKVRRYLELYFSERWRDALSVWPLILTVTSSDARARSLCQITQGVVKRAGATAIGRAFKFTSSAELNTARALAPIWLEAGGVRPATLLETSHDGAGPDASAPNSRHGPQP